MRRSGMVGAGLTCVLALAGCAAFAPPLLPVRSVDGKPFEPVVAASKTSVAKVSGTSCSGDSVVGSAFVVSDHLVLTAAHVAAGARTIELTFPGRPTVTAQLVDQVGDDDTALLRVSGTLPPALRLAATPIVSGDPVAVVGYPLAAQAVRTGVARISAVDERALLEGHLVLSLLVVDAEVPVGSSGGPVIDATGAVQGMVSSQSAGRGGRDSSGFVTLAIPATRLAGRVTSWGERPAPTPCT